MNVKLRAEDEKVRAGSQDQDEVSTRLYWQYDSST